MRQQLYVLLLPFLTLLSYHHTNTYARAFTTSSSASYFPHYKSYKHRLFGANGRPHHRRHTMRLNLNSISGGDVKEAEQIVSNWITYPKEQQTGDESSRKEGHPSVSTSSSRAWSESQYKESLELYDRLMNCDDNYLAPMIKEALHTLDGAYRLYGPTSMVGSYNGGKDAVVIMHLMRAAHAHHFSLHPTLTPTQPNVLYFSSKHEFPEVLTFLHATVDRYDLSMIAFDPTHSFTSGLSILVDDVAPIPLAFVLGTRRGDPNAGHQGTFAPSSDWMPPFMRVNPVVHWTYGHVWHFLRLYELPYCKLYDEGYTSLGSVKDTLPCPALKRPQGGYWPAYMLKDYDMERSGRIAKVKKSIKTEEDKVSTEEDKVSTTTDDKLSSTSSNLSIRAATSTSSLISSTTTNDATKTVGLIIIGDEILKGITRDTNTQTAASLLRAHGVPLARVVVVSDDHDEIVQEIQTMVRDVDVVITSGGVGPTHDDVTMTSVSTALSRPLESNEEMMALLREKMGGGIDGRELTEAQMKMAYLPQDAKLRYFGDEEWPILQCRNIFILPGIPQFFEAKMSLVAPYLATEGVSAKRITYKVVLSVDETSIVDTLNQVVKRHPHVSFGSYPFMSHPDYKTVVTLEGKESQRQRGSFVGLSLRKLADAAAATASGDDDGEKGNANFTREEIDMHVKVALEDLLKELPEKSILRVDADDNLI